MHPRRRARPSRRSLLWQSAPALIGAGVILALALGALRVGAGNLRAAETDRINARKALTTGNASHEAAELAPSQRLAVTSLARYTRQPSGLNDALLKQVQADPGVSGIVFVALLTTDGHLVQAVPTDTTIDVGSFGDTWTQATRGHAGMANAIRRQGALVDATLWPVGEGTPWGVLIMGEVLSRTPTQTLLAQLGSQNGEPGGLFIADRRGVVVASWDVGAVGTQPLTPDAVGGLGEGDVRVVTTGAGADEMTTIVTPLTDGYVTAFTQRTDLLLGDLRAAQHQRDLTLVSVLAVALVALLAFQVSREARARRDEARIDALLASSRDVVLVVDSAGVLSFVSPAMEKLLGQSAVTWTGRPVTDLCHPDDADRLRQLVDDAQGSMLNVRLATGTGDHRWFDLEASDLRATRNVGGVLLTCHEIGERKELQDELLHQATHDRLTGLLNRAELIERLEDLVHEGRPVREFALLYVDLDYFKPVNDSLGHDAGDQALIQIAQRLEATVGPEATVCRIGGDEFAILLDRTREPAAWAAAGDVREAVRRPLAVHSHLVHLDASVGIALADPSLRVHSAELLVRQADGAMYRAKTSGRGRIEIAIPELAAASPNVTVTWDDAADPAASSPQEHPAPADVNPAPADTAAETGSGAATASAPATTATLAAATAAGADAGPGAERGRSRRRFALVPVLVAAAVVVGTAAVGFAQTVVGQRAAEAEMVRDAAEVLARSAVYESARWDPRRFQPIAENAPWTLDGSAVDQAIVVIWATNPQAGKDCHTFLFAPDGRILASYPPGAGTNLTEDPAWPEAVAGRPTYLPAVDDPDEPRTYEVLPIHRNGKVAALVAQAASNRVGAGPEAMRQNGEAYRNGGFSLLDARGTIYSSWNPDLIGRPLADRSELAPAAPGRTQVLERADAVLLVTPITSTTVPSYLALEVPTADFYHDLRLGQAQRDLSLLALVVTAVLGLALVAYRREQSIRRSEARLDALLHNAHDVVVVLDEHGRARFVSSAVHRLLGYDPADAMGRSVLHLVHPDDRERLTDMVRDARASAGASAIDIRLCDAQGEHRWFDISAVDRRGHRDIAGLVLTCHAVSERKALQDQLADRATRDPLTGLPNRATLSHRLERLAEGDGAPFAILFIDLDHFKPVNDTYGHDAGDAVLRVVAERFEQNVRGGDPSSSDLVCRLGGDEFAVVLANATEGIAGATAARLLDAARQPIRVQGHAVQIAATIGISLSHPRQANPDQTVREADQAMYHAKEAGRNTFIVAP